MKKDLIFQFHLYIYTNLLANVIVTLPHPQSEESQGEETVLVHSADKPATTAQSAIYKENIKSHVEVDMQVKTRPPSKKRLLSQ